jgi:Flp pilus assembly protein TadG
MIGAINSLTRICVRARRAAAGFAASCSGIAATEFAVIVPLMLVALFGTVEFSSGVAIDRKVTLIARTLADLTSQAKVVSDLDIANFRTASNYIMMPYAPPAPYPAPTTTISELYIDPATGVARVQWSVGSAPRTAGTPVAIPPSLIAVDATGKIIPNQYVLYSEASFLYTPAVDFAMNSTLPTFNLRDVAYTRPRQSTCVFYPSTPAIVPPATSPACPTL